MEWIGIYGGTFDPIHYGHLKPALEVQQALALDKVLFVPCYQPVHRAMPQVSAQQRCDLVRKAIQNQPSFSLNTLEIDKGGASYMVETLAALKLQMPNAHLVLMMGTDAFAQFHSWRDWQGILNLANLAVMQRPGETMPTQTQAAAIYHKHQAESLTAMKGQIMEVAVTPIDISATLIRAKLQQGASVKGLLPPCVASMIKQHSLYQA